MSFHFHPIFLFFRKQLQALSLKIRSPLLKVRTSNVATYRTETEGVKVTYSVSVVTMVAAAAVDGKELIVIPVG